MDHKLCVRLVQQNMLQLVSNREDDTRVEQLDCFEQRSGLDLVQLHPGAEHPQRKFFSEDLRCSIRNHGAKYLCNIRCRCAIRAHILVVILDAYGLD